MHDLIAEVWESMTAYEYYTPRDIANTLGLSVEQVWRVMDFLIHHGFLELVVGNGALVKKNPIAISPSLAFLMLEDIAEGRIGRISK